MTWETWSDVATVTQAVLLPVSLGLVWYQLRKQSQLTRAANTQALVELSSPFNLLLIQDPEFAKLWVHGASNFDSMGKVDQYRFKSLIIWWMIFHENIYYQRQRKLIDDTTYRGWDSDLRKFVVDSNLPKHWPEFGDVCQKDFVAYVQKLIAANGATGP
jgi:hypothetical protein